MRYDAADTIAAIATAQGIGAVAIVRISGADAAAILSRVFHPKSGKPLASHVLTYGHVLQEGQPVDEAMAVLMLAPRSYTREDVAEIQCHGGVLGAREVLALCLTAGARMALPGEFTRRAFLNGRIDLAQAEAVMELIAAGGAAAQRAAMSQAEGGLSRRIRQMAVKLTDALAALEAALDYPEEDFAEEAMRAGRLEAAAVLDEAQHLLSQERQGRILRSGASVALIGRPNAGKSSLFNALLDSARAIVTDIPGTTRDVVEEQLSIGGVPVRLMDTAGLRDTQDVVEQEGVRRSRQAAQQADVQLIVLDGTDDLTQEDCDALSMAGEGALLVRSKADLPQHGWQMGEVLPVSAVTGEGMQALRERILQRVLPAGGEDAPTVSLRHADCLRRAVLAMQRAQDAPPLPELLAQDLREGLEALCEITGEHAGQNVIDAVFERFCLGK